MIYPRERYQNLQGWIPESDIDGIDAKKKFLASVKNIDFENGFLSQAVAPVESLLPDEIRTLTESEGYELLAGTTFDHDIQGAVFVFVLWHSSLALRIFVQEVDNNEVIEVNLDEQNNDITFTEKPSNINFCLSNNQLKINLNCLATYNALSEEVLLNLTLAYLKGDHPSYWQDYVASDSTEGTYREHGWYCFPRWLGWSLQDAVTMGDAESSQYTEDMENSSYESWFDDGLFIHNTDADYYTLVGNSSGALKAGEPNNGDYAYFTIQDVYAINQIIFKAAASANIAFQVLVDGLTEIASGEVSIGQQQTISIDLGLVKDAPVDLRVVFPAIPAGAFLVIGSVTVTAYTGAVILVKNFDGQRALVQDTAKLAIFAASEIEFDMSRIDWRVSAFEVYIKRDGIYYIASSIPIEASWTLDGTTLSHELVGWSDDDIAQGLDQITLNFNYGLSEDVSVNNQKVIYSEVFYRNRTYFVKGDEKVYQSHLSGTGKAQPDSFPYNEEVDFGFWITSNGEKNRALALTNLDEVMILGKRNYVYFIEFSGGTPLRFVKTVNGKQGILNSQAIMRGLSGQPESTILMWYNDNGIFAHAGGKGAPEEVSKLTLANYWLALDKDDSFAFHNPIKDEFWICLSDRILIYDIQFGKFKVYEYDFEVIGYVGVYDNKLYIIGKTSGGVYKLYKVDYTASQKLPAEFETHYWSNTIMVENYPIEAVEDETKILQELYIAVNNKGDGLISFIIIPDGNEYSAIKMSTQRFTVLTQSPILVRYGKIKLKLKLPANAGTLREFGYSFSVPNQAPAQEVHVQPEGIGMSSGLSAGIGL